MGFLDYMHQSPKLILLGNAEAVLLEEGQRMKPGKQYRTP
jgi:hypothetical protein